MRRELQMSPEKPVWQMATIRRILVWAGLLFLCSVASRADSWTSAPPMPTARTGLAVARSRDGKIFAIGGSGLRTVEAFDASSHTWMAVAQMPTGRIGLASATDADGKIYALGGESGLSVPLATVEVYDPATNAWRTSSNMSIARFG